MLGMSLAEVTKQASYPSPFQNTEEARGGPDEEGGARRVATPADAGAGASPATSRDLSFLYSRESDRFGEGTRSSDSTLSSRVPARGVGPHEQAAPGLGLRRDASRPPTLREVVEDLLSRYKHRPKEQKNGTRRRRTSWHSSPH